MMKQSLLITMFCCIIMPAAWAQTSFTGTWQGKINVGPGLRLVFDVEQKEGAYTATITAPDQSSTPMDCDRAEVKGDSLIMTVDKVKGRYAGEMQKDGSLIGSWTQGAKATELNLKKVDKVAVAERPQTPKPPFPYKSEDVLYYNQDKSIQYGATITIPEGKGPFPAIIMSTGSGAQNRDEEIYRHKPFAVIADYLTRKGYIVLRVDDQRVGKTTGSATNTTTADYAKDVMNGLDYLKGRSEVNKKKLGVMGRSEGGLIAEMVAALRKDIDFVVLLAAPGMNIVSVMEEQNAAVLKENNINKEAIEAYLPLYNRMALIVAHAGSHDEAEKELRKAITDWKTKVHPNIARVFGLANDEGIENMTKEFTALYDAPWWRYFMGAEPNKYIENMSCKVLALNGDKDIQIISESNLAGLRESLAKSKSPKYDLHEMKGMNHLFQTCKKCTLAEYASLEETFSPQALKLIGDWLDENVK